MNEKIQKTRPIQLTPFSRSQVDILIPFHAQYEKVLELIRSIVISVKSNPYRVTLIDDCSDNTNFGQEIQRQFVKITPEGFSPQVQYIRSEQRLGFGGALKLGFESTELPWVLFMHSDCLVEDPNFMLHMGQSLLNWKKQGVPVKIVSARSNNPCDCEQAKASSNEKEGEDIILKQGTLPLFCAMCHRDLFRYIGGFIKPYPYAWYEDEELAFRMKKKGLLQGISVKSWIKHHGGSTIKYVWENDKESKKIMDSNYNLCLSDMKIA